MEWHIKLIFIFAIAINILIVVVIIINDKISYFLFIFLLPAGSAAGSSAGISFTHGPIFGVFRPARATRCTDQGQI